MSAFLAAVFALLFYFGRGLPDQAQLQTYEPQLTNRFCISTGEVWRDYAVEKRFFCPLDMMPELLIQAFLIAEDRQFYTHPGLDISGVFRAAIKNTLSGKWSSRPMGASTITQQIVKNFFAGTERSLTRKIKEAIMALRLEQSLSKKRILELYLNQIYLGAGSYGVVAAAETYFQKKIDDLSVDETAYLAALPKAPTTYQSEKNPVQTKARRDWVLQGLYEAGHIDGHTFLLGRDRPISLPSKPIPQTFEGEYFIEAARLDLMKRVGKKSYIQGGYTLSTTVKPDIQNMAARALCYGLELYDKGNGYRGPLAKTTGEEYEKVKKEILEKITLLPGYKLVFVKEDKGDHLVVRDEMTTEINVFKENMKWCGADIPKMGDVVMVRLTHDQQGSQENFQGQYELAQIPEVTGGIVVMEASTGRVLGLSGGYHFKLNQYNAATQAHRQPGSTFKTFVFLAALERGYTKETKVMDAPIHIPLGFTTADGKRTYSPKNYSNKFYGARTLAFGLSRSINVLTVRLAMQVGLKPIARIARIFGIYETMPRQLAMMLGAGETTLLKLTGAFAMLANGGKKITPTLVDNMEDRYGKSIYIHDIGLQREVTTEATIDVRETVARPESITAMKDMLTLAISEGTGRVLRPLNEKYGVAIAGKTGTSNNCKDAWFVGFVGDIVVGVFIGYPTPRSLGESATGGRVATPIAYHFLDAYFLNKNSL